MLRIPGEINFCARYSRKVISCAFVFLFAFVSHEGTRNYLKCYDAALYLKSNVLSSTAPSDWFDRESLSSANDA